MAIDMAELFNPGGSVTGQRVFQSQQRGLCLPPTPNTKSLPRVDRGLMGLFKICISISGLLENTIKWCTEQETAVWYHDPK